MRRLVFSALLLLPLAAAADGRCKYEAPRNLQLDLAGVRAVQIAVNSYDLHLKGDAQAKGLDLRGRACASSQEALDRLTVTQRREGDQLILELGGDRGGFSFFGSTYTDLDVTVTLPASLPVTLDVGSGDADASGVQALSSHVGSGDLHVNGAGRLVASVGSGDVDARDLGSLELGSVGSGDFKAGDIKGDAKIGSVGSGDVSLRRVGGNVHADTIGSGDLDVDDVGGELVLGAKGSGDVNYHGVRGKVSVPRDDD